MRSRALLGGALVVLLAGCGQDAGTSGDEPATGADRSGPATSLTITVVADEGAEPRVMTLTCDPVGGDHPNARAACDALAAAGPSVLEPVPQGRPCTMIYGGPQTATITGTLDGEQLDAELSRADGCEIARWDALGTEVLDVPLQ